MGLIWRSPNLESGLGLGETPASGTIFNGMVCNLRTWIVMCNMKWQYLFFLRCWKMRVWRLWTYHIPYMFAFFLNRNFCTLHFILFFVFMKSCCPYVWNLQVFLQLFILLFVKILIIDGLMYYCSLNDFHLPTLYFLLFLHGQRVMCVWMSLELCWSRGLQVALILWWDSLFVFGIWMFSKTKSVWIFRKNWYFHCNMKKIN